MQIVDGIVRAYVNLWAVQRPPVHAALTALLSALSARAVALQEGHCGVLLPSSQSPGLNSCKPADDIQLRLWPVVSNGNPRTSGCVTCCPPLQAVLQQLINTLLAATLAEPDQDTAVGQSLSLCM